ncbi:MAG TPA: hypothetical protein VM165_02070 [Planctomycetaceae bacterium]|nr:hypothetical protein [Planctomycetaceae bacterium]
METKTIDSRGRLALGAEFAGKTVLVKKTETGLEIVSAVVIPEYEVWMLRNPEARESLERAIAQAAEREFVEPPPVIDDAWADEDLDG